MSDTTQYIILYGALLILLGVGYVGASYMEARTFNKFSSTTKATTVDAVFAKLRVEGCR